MFIVTRVLTVVSRNLSYSQHLGAGVKIACRWHCWTPQLRSSSPFGTPSAAHGCAGSCTLNITPIVCHCTVHSKLLLCAAALKRKSLSTGTEQRLSWTASAAHACRCMRTYFGVRQPLIASFADPKEGNYPVVDA